MVPFIDSGIESLSGGPISPDFTSRKDIFRNNSQIKMRQTVACNGQCRDDPFHLFNRFLEHEDG